MVKTQKPKQISFRVTEEQYLHFMELTRISGLTQQAYVVGLIESSWDKLQGNPKLRDAYAKLKELSDALDGIYEKYSSSEEGGI